ncbi:MAG: hypothetical protein AB1585_12270 [Thermodesulfobacteriota bacterium]
MTLEQIQFRRAWAGRLGALLSLLLFLVILDALVARFREPLNRFSGLPGTSLAVNGPLAEKIDRIQDLSFQSPSPDIRLEFENLQTGFWLGGNLWNGRLHIGPQIRPGQYPLAVLSGKAGEGPKAFFFRIEVFPDQPAMRKSSKSFLISTLGLYPWPTALTLAPLILLTFGAVFWLSHQSDALLARQGKAEIYRLKKTDQGLEIFFGLGKNHGLKPGDPLTLINSSGARLGSVTVTEVQADYSAATVEAVGEVRPGLWVCR